MSNDHEMNSPEDRRELRRKRRRRTQAIVLIVTILFCAAAAGGIGYGVKTLISVIQEKKAQEAAEEAASVEAAAEEAASAAAAAIETPQEDAVVVPEVQTTEEMLSEYVDETISGMSLEDKVAGLFVVTPEELTGYASLTEAGDVTGSALTQYPVGGIIYQSDNIVDASQFSSMISATTGYSKYPLFYGVEEEGGENSVIANSAIGTAQTQSPAEIGATGDAANAYTAASTIGAYLSSLGINLDLAPTADVLINADNTTVGSSSFGADPAVDAQMAAQFVMGLQDGGVSACVKNFPGLGDTTTDDQDGYISSERTADDLNSGDYISFAGAINAGADMVMVSHLSLPNVTIDDVPASLSSAMITDQLRGVLQFQGIVITDSLSKQAITDRYSAAEAAVMAIQAGADMLLMPSSLEEAYNGVLAAVQDGTITEDRINESLKRIYTVKLRSSVESIVNGGTEETAPAEEAAPVGEEAPEAEVGEEAPAEQ